MNIPGHIFKGYDIRGIYPEEFNEENIVPITQAIYAFFMSRSKADRPLTIAVGRDMRISSPSLFKKVVDTLVDLGQNVIDVGLVSTPSFYFSVFSYRYDAGIQVSASHNPKEWNGMKIVLNSPKGLLKIGRSTGLEEIKQNSIKIAEEGLKDFALEKGTIAKKEGVLTEEVKKALEITGNPKLKKFKAVADAANAMAGTYLEELYKHIPGELIKMNFKLDGTFPVHQPDPMDPKNLVDLQKKVLEEKADVGYAPDGDGDRFFYVDEKGGIVKPSIITALVARELLKENKGEKILFDIRYVLTPQRIVAEHGGTTEMTKVGHAFITEKMHETGAIFAGESSAHYFFKATGNAEAQLPVILFVLKVMTETGKPLSEIAKELDRSHESGEINFKVKNPEEVIEILQNGYHDGELSTLDGISITYPDWRFSVRTSNTEHGIFRLNVEEEIVSAKGRHKEIVELINKHGKFKE